MSDLFSLSVHEITKKIKDGKLTSVEICKSYIDRINKFEKDVKAWAYLDKTLLLEMDVKGSMSVKKLYPQHTFSIFILPPSLEHLRKRLKNRGTDSNDRIEIRLERFQQEIEFQNKFDQVMINENLELAKVELINIVNKLKQGVINGT